MKIAILGFGKEGQSAYSYWRSGNEITVCDSDKKIKPPKDVTAKFGPDYLKDLGEFDLIVRSPAIHPDAIAAANPGVADLADKITSSTNEFFRVCPTKNIIGVTGTKGKGTTTTLLAHMLEAAGERVHLGGNIGVAALDLLKENIKPKDWVILELSNFQLIDLKYSPGIAICLMIEPEHLNWHATIDEYMEAKRQLFRHQTENGLAIYYADNKYSLSIAQASPGVLMPYMAAPGAEVIENEIDKEKIMIDGHKICDIGDIRLLGKHNWQNVCAAVTAAWQITHDQKAIHKAISSFVGLPHRLEFVREVDGIRYYNDSFGSAPGATVAAMDAIPGSKIMIVGGFERGLDLSELARGFITHQENLRRVVLVGESGPRLEKEVQAHGFNNYDLLHSKHIEEIVDHARGLAQQGDTIVLSPGFASFDMFKDFEERGIKYKDYVNSLV